MPPRDIKPQSKGVYSSNLKEIKAKAFEKGRLLGFEEGRRWNDATLNAAILNEKKKCQAFIENYDRESENALLSYHRQSKFQLMEIKQNVKKIKAMALDYALERRQYAAIIICMGSLAGVVIGSTLGIFM